MKTFIVLFVIAISLPSEAQRVKENVRQRVEIYDASSMEQASEKPFEKGQDQKDDGKRKRDNEQDSTNNSMRKR